MNTVKPECNPVQLAPTLRPELLSVIQKDYVDLEVLPSLEAELPLPLWYAKRATSQNRVILVDLGAEDGSTTRTDADSRSQRAMAFDVQHFGVPEIAVVDGGTDRDTERGTERGTGESTGTGQNIRPAGQSPPPYLAWTVENGKSLRSSLLSNEDRSPRRVLEIARSVAETLAELHRYDHVVGALTPASIWLGPAGMIQLLGLGLSSFDATHLYGAGLRYRAPEQLRTEPRSMAERLLGGTMRQRADIWALGIIVLELVDHRPRFRCQDPSELLEEIQDSTLTLTSKDIPWELGELLTEMLVIDVEHRTITGDEISEQIDGLLMSGSVTGGQALGTGEAIARGSSPSSASTNFPNSASNHRSSSRPRDWNWRSAARDLESRRQAFDQDPAMPMWKVWILPMLALAAMALCLWGLLQMTGQ